MLDAAAIKGRVPTETVLRHSGSEQDREGRWQCPFSTRHRNGDAHFSVTVKDGRAKCWSQGCLGDHGADVFELVGLLEGLSIFTDQRRRVCEIGGIADAGNGKAHQRIMTTYPYTDEAGKLLFQVVRYEPKDFRQRRPDGNGGWVWNLQGVRVVLYRLPDALKAEAVLILEGEKDVDTAYRLGLPDGWAATCNPMGAGKWRPEYSDMLKGKRVVILPDADEPGRRHGEQVARSLKEKAAEILTVTLPHGKDLSEWAESGGTAEAFRCLLVADAPQVGTETSQALSILDDVHQFLGRFVSYPSKHARVAHTLWIVHTHLMDAWESTPRLAFLSPEPGSGKTRALEITELLVPRPVEAINTTPAYLFRKISDSAGSPTILYDEIDTLFGPRAKEHEEIRAILNAGHRRGAKAGRCVVRGRQVETEELSAYCAVALAGLGGLPDTILTRSICIRMRRRAPSEQIEPYRRRIHAPEGHPLRDRLAKWAAGIPRPLPLPTMPEGITDRPADVWEALLAVANVAGGEWPERARVSAVTFVTDAMGDEDNVSLGVRLLADLRIVFGSLDSMPTTDILERLNGLEESPWADLKGKPLDARRLANLLSLYRIKRKTFRTATGTAKGYRREDLHDAWERYLPAAIPDGVEGQPPEESVTSVTVVTAIASETSTQVAVVNDAPAISIAPSYPVGAKIRFNGGLGFEETGTVEGHTAWNQYPGQTCYRVGGRTIPHSRVRGVEG